MKPIPLLRIVGLSAFLGLVSFLLPLPTHAGVRVSVGIGLPVPVFVAPAPVVVAPQPVIVYPGSVVYEAAPVLVPGYYGHPSGSWRYPRRHHGYDGYRQGGWRHQHQHRGHRR